MKINTKNLLAVIKTFKAEGLGIIFRNMGRTCARAAKKVAANILGKHGKTLGKGKKLVYQLNSESKSSFMYYVGRHKHF